MCYKLSVCVFIEYHWEGTLTDPDDLDDVWDDVI